VRTDCQKALVRWHPLNGCPLAQLDRRSHDSARSTCDGSTLSQGKGRERDAQMSGCITCVCVCVCVCGMERSSWEGACPLQPRAHSFVLSLSLPCCHSLLLFTSSPPSLFTSPFALAAHSSRYLLSPLSFNCPPYPSIRRPLSRASASSTATRPCGAASPTDRSFPLCSSRFQSGSDICNGACFLTYRFFLCIHPISQPT